MKALKLNSLLFILIVFLSCSNNDDSNNNNDDQNGLANFQTTCSDGNENNLITGPTGAYWEYALTAIIPINSIPILKNPQLLPFDHSSPYISLTLPQGYKAIETRPFLANAPIPLGIDINRNDNAVTWDYVPISEYPGQFTVNDVIKVVIDNMLFSYGIHNIDDVVCSVTIPQNISSINNTFSGRLLKFGDFTAIVYVIVTELALGNLNVSSFVAAGPTIEFNTLVTDIFLPLHYQLRFGSDGLSDRDNDGTPDIYDSNPDDPNVP